jgi:hypothetical protein
MSSVTRFLRQIPTGTNFVGEASALIAAAYDFIPTSGNYVGNYPPGFVCPASQTNLAATLAAANVGAGSAVIRDMGKTIFANTSTTGLATGLTSNAGYFREYQLLKVNPINTTAPGFIGGSTGSNFGVVGQAALGASPLSYATFYVPVVVNGIYAGSTAALPVQLAGGQL